MRRIPLAALLLILAAAARAGTPDVPDEINARLARTKSQTAIAAAGRAHDAASVDGVASFGATGGAKAGGGALGDGCNIAIGNVFEDKGAISTSARRETTVIVTGDVIQVGNNCR